MENREQTKGAGSFRKEFDSHGEVDVPSGALWGAQTQRALEHFSIGQDLIPREMIAAFAILKKAAAKANRAAAGSMTSNTNSLLNPAMRFLRVSTPKCFLFMSGCREAERNST